MSGGPPGKRTATLQVCDLHRQCAVRELNPQPADSDYQLWVAVASCENHYVATKSDELHHWLSVVSCRCLSSKDVSKSVCVMADARLRAGA